LTGYVWHQGTQNCPLHLKRTAVFRAETSTKGVLSEISEQPGTQVAPHCREKQPYETSGNQLVGPDGGISSATFEANDTTIVFASPDSGSCGGLLMTYTKAP